MKTIYKCSECDQEFKTREECISHEIGVHALDENLKGIDVLASVKDICISHGRCSDGITDYDCPFCEGPNGCVLADKPYNWNIISKRYDLEELTKLDEKIRFEL